MSYEFQMQNDGTLYIKVNGDITEADAEKYLQELRGFAEQLPVGKKLDALLDTTEIGQVSPNVRRAVSGQLDDPRFGKTAVLGNNRFVKVLIDFLMKATRRDDMRYFTEIEKALSWLKNEGSG